MKKVAQNRYGVITGGGASGWDIAFKIRAAGDLTALKLRLHAYSLLNQRTKAPLPKIRTWRNS